MAPSRHYLEASRQAETDRLRVEEERRDAELRAAKEHADSLRRRSRVLQAVLAVTAVVAVVAVVASFIAMHATTRANERTQDARILREISDAQFMLADQRRGGDTRAIQQLLAANAVRPGDAVDNAMLNALIDRRRLTKVSDTGGDVVSVSATGRGLVLGSPKDPMRVLDAETGQPVGPAITDPDGHRVASLSPGRPTRGNHFRQRKPQDSWDVDSGRPSGPMISGKDAGYASQIATSPDGRLTATFGPMEATVKIWDVETARPATGDVSDVVMPLPPTSVAFDRDGRRLAVGLQGGGVRLVDVATGALVGPTFGGHTADVTSIAFSDDGSRIASGSEDQTVRVYDVRTGAEIGAPLREHQDWVRSVALNRDGSVVASGSDDRTMVIWYPDDGSGYTLTGHHDSVTDVAFSADGAEVYSGSTDKSLRVWSVAEQLGGTTEPTKHLQRNDEMMIAGLHLDALYTQNKLLEDALVEKTGKPANTTPMPRIEDAIKGTDIVTSNVAFTRDRGRFAIAGQDGRIHVIDAGSDKQVVKPLGGHEDWNLRRRLQRRRGRARLRRCRPHRETRNTATGQQIRQFASDNDQLVRSVAISPDKHRIVAGYEDGTLRRWDADTGKPLGDLMTGHTRGAGSVAFSPDGTRIVSGSDDKALRMWDAATGQPVGEQ